MRERKFRAWDTRDEGKMISWEQIKHNAHRQLFGGYFELFNRQELIPMQYTGFKDKNRVEIYEGDRIRYNREEYVIRWDDDRGCYLYERPVWSKDQHGWQLTCDIAWESEVIGNIYENPELKGD